MEGGEYGRERFCVVWHWDQVRFCQACVLCFQIRFGMMKAGMGLSDNLPCSYGPTFMFIMQITEIHILPHLVPLADTMSMPTPIQTPIIQ